MTDLIVFDSGHYTNFDANTKGVEVALEGHWTNGISRCASYSFQYTRRLFGGLVGARFTQQPG